MPSSLRHDPFNPLMMHWFKMFLIFYVVRKLWVGVAVNTLALIGPRGVCQRRREIGSCWFQKSSWRSLPQSKVKRCLLLTFLSPMTPKQPFNDKDGNRMRETSILWQWLQFMFRWHYINSTGVIFLGTSKLTLASLAMIAPKLNSGS